VDDPEPQCAQVPERGPNSPCYFCGRVGSSRVVAGTGTGNSRPLKTTTTGGSTMVIGGHPPGKMKKLPGAGTCITQTAWCTGSLSERDTDSQLGALKPYLLTRLEDGVAFTT
jgi:hypothetical protein